MTTTTKNSKDPLGLYDGFQIEKVGAASIDPDLYASKSYARKKESKIIIGGINRIKYLNADHDAIPLILTIGLVPQYSAFLAYNLNYVPKNIRKAMIDLVIKQNKKRIQKNQPMIVDYATMKRAIPVSSKIVRLYKVQLTKTIEVFPLVAWGTAIDSGSKWSSHYKKGTSNENALQRLIRSVKGFF